MLPLDRFAALTVLAMLDQSDFVTPLVEFNLVHKGTHQQDAAATGPFQIFGRRRVGKMSRIEAAPFVANDKLRHLSGNANSHSDGTALKG